MRASGFNHIINRRPWHPRRRPIKLYLIRHGETVWNKQRIIQGSGSDTELSETGKMQVAKLALAVKDVPFTAIYSSPMQRAMETAGAIAGHHGLEVHPEPDLREIHVGELEGMSMENFAKGFSQYLVDWQTKGEELNFNGGEKLGEFRDRVWSVVEKIVKSNPGATVALVSHYFVTATIVCTALGLPLTDLVRIRIQPSSRSVLEFEAGCAPRLLLLSDICHLREM
ncbi:MAG: histidine phosphatase family protein [Dehalococcoidia bacterium]